MTRNTKSVRFIIFWLHFFKSIEPSVSFSIQQEFPPGSVCVCVLLIRLGHNMESSEPKAYLAFCVSIGGPVAMDTNQTDHNLHNDLFFSYLEPQIQSVPALEWCLPGLWVFSGSAIGVLTSCNVSIAFLSVICIFFFHSYCNKNRQNKVGSPLACSSDS